MDGINVKINWDAPLNSNGDAVTAYRIYIKTKAGALIEELDTCNGANSAIVTATECIVPMSTFTGSPFLLVLNDPIIATVEAKNTIGYSTASDENPTSILT
jgi:hypothetical protein